MNNERKYKCDDTQYEDLVPALTAWLNQNNFDTQVLKTPEGKTLVQLSKHGGWRKAIGMSTALNVLLSHHGSALTVEVGAGRWIDKAAAGTISIFILWPLMVTAAIGTWNQIKMPEKVFGFIGQLLENL